MTSLSLSFNDVKLNQIQQNDNQIWLKAADLANALGYARVDSLNKVFERNADEFDYTMTQVIDITDNANLTFSNLVSKTRIFSLRGAHLITFFARTPVAKQFRKWALDILEKEIKPKAKTIIDDRIPLAEAVGLLVSKSSLNTVEVYKMLHQRFDVEHVEDIPLESLPYAVEYVHNLTAVVSQSHQLQRQDQKQIQQLVEAVINQNFKMVNVWNALRQLNPTEFFKYSSLIVRANELALDVSKRYNMRGSNSQPLISKDFRIVNMSNGEIMDTNPNWFNAPA
ncbi:BRO-N domain-containing protein [Acinetobacter brisouii]|uniref:BRO-N domain-containing protein n=1 Tax=Acinetobacter brisouii TaxID=396323 RepID=UPI0005F816E7|nr:BRO family protein [Acinetobacter brisouii]KJV37906.1 alpha/beta hydrolase [Acinetobacter brisouii]